MLQRGRIACLAAAWCGGPRRPGCGESDGGVRCGSRAGGAGGFRCRRGAPFHLGLAHAAAAGRAAPTPVTGRPPTRLQLAPGARRSQAVKDVAAQLPAGAWQHMQRKEGSQGPLCADFAALRVVASRRAQPGPDVWLLLRRQARTAQLKTYLMQGPADMTRAQLVRLAAMRWPIETCFQQGKQLLGLGTTKDAAGPAGITT